MHVPEATLRVNKPNWLEIYTKEIPSALNETQRLAN